MIMARMLPPGGQDLNGTGMTGFVQASSEDPHRKRMRQLLAAHPELRRLVRNEPISALFVAALVVIQVGLAFALSDAPAGLMLLTAYTAGPVLSLGLWALIHDCIHDLVFRSKRANAWLMILANLPLLVPAATSFRKYHIMHHRFQGDPTRDGDIPTEMEARLVGSCPLRKSLWLLAMPLIQCLRATRLEQVRFFDGWFLANLAAQAVFVAGIALIAGPWALLYLLVSSLFAVGLHPLGARWIQEHFVLEEGQETASYYGPLNRLVFNAGYHNEHHDLMGVPWMHLPRVRAAAPEFYDTLHAHRSWTRLLFKFLFDPQVTLFSRTIRCPAAGRTRKSAQ